MDKNTLSVFTIQNVPIKQGFLFQMKVLKVYLQYKMFLLNKDLPKISFETGRFTIQNVPIKREKHNNNE